METTNVPHFVNGKIGYIEIPALIAEESAAFYQKVFAWKIETAPDGIITFVDGIGEVAGIWKTDRKPMAEPGLIVSIMVDNVNETISLLELMGAEIVNRMEFDGQYLAWFIDIAGNLLGIYQHPGGGHGKICYLEIPAFNIENSSAFYEAVFNWSLKEKGTEHVGFDDITNNVSGMWTLDRNPSGEPGILVHVFTDNIDATLNLIVKYGGNTVSVKALSAKMNKAIFSDPFGNVFGLYQTI